MSGSNNLFPSLEHPMKLRKRYYKLMDIKESNKNISPFLLKFDKDYCMTIKD